jgi:hypothetical protein
MLSFKCASNSVSVFNLIFPDTFGKFLIKAIAIKVIFTVRIHYYNEAL